MLNYLVARSVAFRAESPCLRSWHYLPLDGPVRVFFLLFITFPVNSRGSASNSATTASYRMLFHLFINLLSLRAVHFATAEIVGEISIQQIFAQFTVR